MLYDSQAGQSLAKAKGTLRSGMQYWRGVAQLVAHSRLGISGWVCNLSDGDVELELEGEEAPIREFLRVLKTGHPYARVSSLQTRELTGTGKYSGFEIR